MISGIVLIVIGIAMIFLSISFIGKLLRTLNGRKSQVPPAVVGRPRTHCRNHSRHYHHRDRPIFVHPTSLIVPLAGTGVFSLRQVYAFTLGANIGTCFTALLAAMAVSGDDAIFALQIAIVHLLFNIFGILVVYGIPFLREIPIWEHKGWRMQQ